MTIEGLNKIIYEKYLTKQASCLEMLALMMTKTMLSRCCYYCHVN